MRIQNITRSTELASSAKEVRGFFGRLAGLINKKKLAKDEGLIIYRCSAVHTMWMKYPIDIVFVDSQLRIRKLIRHLKPWSFSPLVMSACIAIELPVETINRSLTEMGDQLSFSNSKSTA